MKADEDLEIQKCNNVISEKAKRKKNNFPKHWTAHVKWKTKPNEMNPNNNEKKN